MSIIKRLNCLEVRSASRLSPEDLALVDQLEVEIEEVRNSGETDHCDRVNAFENAVRAFSRDDIYTALFCLTKHKCPSSDGDEIAALLVAEGYDRLPSKCSI